MERMVMNSERKWNKDGLLTHLNIKIKIDPKQFKTPADEEHFGLHLYDAIEDVLSKSAKKKKAK